MTNPTISLRENYYEQDDPRPRVTMMVNDKRACNLDCDDCYLSYQWRLSPEDAARIARKLQTNYRPSYAGSELLMNLEYLPQLREMNQKYILTNGILLHQNPLLFDDLIEAGITEIQMSLNYKEQKDGDADTSKAVAWVTREARERWFRVRLACIVNDQNYHEVEDMCHQAYDMGANAIQLIRYINCGSAKNEPDKNTLNKEQKREFFDLVDTVRQWYNKEEFSIDINGNFGPKPGSDGEEMAACNKYCHAGETYFSIDPHGNVYGCHFLMDSEPIGRLVDESRIELFHNLCDGKRDRCITDCIYENDNKTY